MLSLVLWMVCLCTVSATLIQFHCNTMVNNIFAYDADEKVFVCGLNSPGSWHDGSNCSNCLQLQGREIECTKFVWIKDFCKVVIRVMYWWDHSAIHQQGNCLLIFIVSIETFNFQWKGDEMLAKVAPQVQKASTKLLDKK